MPENNSAVPDNQLRRRRRRTSRSRFSDWLNRVRLSKRERKRLTMQATTIVIVLLCLLIGYYFLGPSLSKPD